MAIYEWSNTNLAYAGYLGISEEDEEKMQWYDELMGVPLVSLEEWTPPILEQYLGDGKKKRKLGIVGDSPSSGMIKLISERAAKALSDIFEKHALLYPVVLKDVPNEKFYMVVVKTIIENALDRDASTGKRYEHEKKPEYFSLIEKWTFNEENLNDIDMFSLPDSKTSIYVSEEFKTRVVEAELTGFGFKTEFWDENPFIS